MQSSWSRSRGGHEGAQRSGATSTTKKNGAEGTGDVWLGEEEALGSHHCSLPVPRRAYRQEESGFSCGQIVIRQRGMALNLEGKFRC